MGIRQWLALGLVVATLSPCSPKTVYGWLDWIIPWEVDDYVSLDRTQDVVLDKLVAEELSWHRSNELPLYRDHLAHLNQQLYFDLTEEQVLAHLDQSSDHWYRLMDRLIPRMMPLIQSFSDAQVAEILDQIAEDEEEMREEFAERTPEERRERADERMQKSLRKWLGKLNGEQKAAIATYNDKRYSTLELWLDYRQEWIARFSEALVQRQDSERLAAELQVLLVEPDSIKPEQYLERIQQNRTLLATGFVTIHGAMTKRQSKHLHGELTDLIEDVEYLIAKQSY